MLINEALGMNLTQTDVITVSSMEDEAVAQVVGRWNAMSTTKQVALMLCMQYQTSCKPMSTHKAWS